LAAISVALILFSIKEFLNPARSINGDFFIYSKTIQTAYNPFMGLLVERKIIIYSDGKSIKGSSEKTREKKLEEESYEYKPQARVRGVLDGFVERRYIRSSKLHLHLVEDNKLSRESTSYITIDLGWGLFKKEILKGKFYSTAGESNGNITLVKKQQIWSSLSI